MLRALTLACLTALAITTVAAPAAAAPVSPPVSQGTAAYLAAHPGGTITGPGEISYGDGAFVVTIDQPEHTTAWADCPSDWFCFYDRPDYGYPRGKLSSCGWQSLATYGWQDRVESAYYNLTRGSVQFFDYGAPLFSVGVGYRAIGYVGSSMNRATDVYRYC